jgi:stage III sporulation protein AG
MWKKSELEDRGFSLRKLKKDQLLILLLVGILLLVIALPSGTEQKETTEGSVTGSNGESNTNEVQTGTQAETQTGLETDNAYVSYLEQHLAEVLSQIDGAGDVTVMITLKSSSEKVIEKDVNVENESVSETDSQGGTRTTENYSKGESTIYNDSGDNGEEPYVSKEISPQIEGVLVVASGGGNAVVKENITESVQALFDIDTHKIRIMKKNET